VPFSKQNRGFTFNGIFFVAMMALAAMFIANMPALYALNLNPLMVGVILGIAYGNTLRTSMPEEWAAGITFCSKRILRLAVAFYGFQLTFQEVNEVGLIGFLTSIIMLLSTLLIGLGVGAYVFKLEKATAFLTAIGAAVCGAAAVLATESVIKAKPHQAAVALLTVVLFGTVAMFAYPALYSAGWLPFSETVYGVYTGGTIHEVAHAVAAGNAVGVEAGTTAVIVKMTRVLMLAPLLLIIGIFMTKRIHSARGADHYKVPIPWFAFGFIGCVIINSLYIIPAAYVKLINQVDIFLLTMAMAALGMEVSIKKLREMGPAPFYLGFVLLLWLSIGGYGVVTALLHYL
jgi:uncharacterized integral membrane protein (TIGR00698 family)